MQGMGTNKSIRCSFLHLRGWIEDKCQTLRAEVVLGLRNLEDLRQYKEILGVLGKDVVSHKQ